MNYPQDILDKHTYLKDYCVLHCFRGSIAHGMHNPDPDSIDDIDTLAVVVPPLDYYFGLKVFGSRGTQEIQEGRYDTVVYDMQKFMALLKNGNPNVLCALWVSPEYIISQRWFMSWLFNSRMLFSTKLAYNAFVGYAYSQLEKMRTGQVYQGYMGEKRKALVAKFGYDPKNAAHCIRLLRMGVEFFYNNGHLLVNRRGIDGPELLAIKNGEWPMQKVIDEAEWMFERLGENKDKCNLPDVPDDEAVNRLCVRLVEQELVNRMELGS